MEKLKRLPKNYVSSVEFEREAVYDPYSNDYSNYGNYDPDNYGRNIKTYAKIEMRIDITDKEGQAIVEGMRHSGLDFIAEQGLSLDKFRDVINEGYIRLPALLRHEDPEIAQLAWILSKYFSKRNEIMPEQIIE